MSFQERVGFRIEKFRRERGMSLKELADSANITVGYLSAVEQGRTPLGLMEAARIACSLGISIDKLVRD